ncbi:olfactory receptor 6B1-like [Pelodytes ibericus]
MIWRNRTLVTEFLLLGFANVDDFKILFFLLFAMIYVVSVAGNVLVIVLVVSNKSLHSAMYFFLCQMSLSDTLFTTIIMPNILGIMLMGGIHIAVTGCMIQFYLLGVPTVAQCLLLAAMSYDRYVAICNPLRYPTIMAFRLQLQIALVCWSLGMALVFIIYIFLTKLEFCDSNVIDYFYCDIAPVVDISCSDTSAVELVTSLTSTPLVLSPFVFIIMTYAFILLTIPTNGRQKAFSTCSSHLTVVFMYYGTLTINYIVPRREHSLNVSKGLSLMYMVATPFFNPIVYSLRNRDIRTAFHRSIRVVKKWMGI